MTHDTSGRNTRRPNQAHINHDNDIKVIDVNVSGLCITQCVHNMYI